MVWAVELSFTSYDMVSTPRWLGLENFESLAADPVFRESLFNTFVYIAGSTVADHAGGAGAGARDQHRACPARATA